jgi:hypothetical protein
LGRVPKAKEGVSKSFKINANEEENREKKGRQSSTTAGGGVSKAVATDQLSVTGIRIFRRQSLPFGFMEFFIFVLCWQFFSFPPNKAREALWCCIISASGKEGVLRLCFMVGARDDFQQETRAKAS